MYHHLLYYRKAICVIDNEEVKGNLHFVQKTFRDTVKLEGTLKFKNSRNVDHGLHVYKHGNTSDNCSHLGEIRWTPVVMIPDSPLFGNIGNIKVDENGESKVSIEIKSLHLYGADCIIGSGLAIHREADGAENSNREEVAKREKLACAAIAVEEFEEVKPLNPYFKP